ncbi:C-GCAxxG-C-C family protein [Sedimentibacter sp. zth1]|uniref:C-GCAxxG-C-C family (seleno)protein n=1 Tax=Sedimentibacter sp. zth1 TaxID=2816908 RepID=UPI001A92D0D4|nr:C-GCAxxG-C-C family (seleno)protein [Sedimentibacter sp. zth1]QSX06373.1 C-GCAxxG-C-C family protein [Sedimentibacter sp. zth1]
MLRDIAKNYYLEQKFNCAQSILMAISEQYKLNLTDSEIELVTAFGGGMGCGKTCGTLTGAVAALGKLLDTKSESFRNDCKEFVQAFEDTLGSTECNVLMEKYKKPETRCLETVMLGADVIEKLIIEKKITLINK